MRNSPFLCENIFMHQQYRYWNIAKNIPKIHKPNNPGRPIINSIECHTSEISRFVDHHLQPVIKQIPSYIKDTNNFINKVNNFSVPVNSILVIMDVRSYQSIPNNEGIAVTKKRHS